MKSYGTWDVFMVEQLKEKEKVVGFLDAIIEEYQIHRDLAIIQFALQYVVEAQGGIFELAKQIDIEPDILSEVLDNTKTPRINTLRTILSTLGCCSALAALENVNTAVDIAAEESAAARIETANPNLKPHEHPVSTEEQELRS